MFCTNCGAPRAPDGAFCTACGSPAMRPVSPGPTGISGPPLAAAPSAPPPGYPVAVPVPYPAPGGSRKRGLKAAVAVVAVIVVLGIVVVAMNTVGPGRKGTCEGAWSDVYGYTQYTRKYEVTQGECNTWCAENDPYFDRGCSWEP